MDDWRVYAGERQKALAAGATYKLAEGNNSIRVLPRLTKEKKLGGIPFEEYDSHRDVGPKKRFVRCGKDMQGQGACWICDVVIPKLQQSSEKAHRARAAALQAKHQFIVQVAWKDVNDKWSGPAFWSVPAGRRSLAPQLLGVLKSTKKDYVSIKKGFNINIERTGTGKFDTKYGSIVTDDEPSEVPRDILVRMKPFEEFVRTYSKDIQKAAYEGRDLEEENTAETFDAIDDDEAATEVAVEEVIEEESVEEEVTEEAVEVEETTDDSMDDIFADADKAPVEEEVDEIEDLFEEESKPVAKKKAAAPPVVAKKKAAQPVVAGKNGKPVAKAVVGKRK